VSSQVSHIPSTGSAELRSYPLDLSEYDGLSASAAGALFAPPHPTSKLVASAMLTIPLIPLLNIFFIIFPPCSFFVIIIWLLYFIHNEGTENVARKIKK
jgi:hypothetical protein